MDIFYYKYKNKIDRYIYQIKDFNDQIIYCAGFSNSIGLTQEIYNNNIKNIFIILSYCLLLLHHLIFKTPIFLRIFIYFIFNSSVFFNFKFFSSFITSFKYIFIYT